MRRRIGLRPSQTRSVFPRLLIVPAALLLAGCGSKQNALEPEGGPAKTIASLWWWMMGGLWSGSRWSCAILVAAWFRRDRPGVPFFRDADRAGWAVVLSLGFAVPIVGLAGALHLRRRLRDPQHRRPRERASTSLTVEVVGHQWWWEVRYPGTSVGHGERDPHPGAARAVNVEVRTDDVIHSFWVPQLNRKIDMIPEQTNRLLLVRRQAGRYRGQCAEFCGLQHAHMALYVFADDPGRLPALARARGEAAHAATSPGARVFAANVRAAATRSAAPRPRRRRPRPDARRLAHDARRARPSRTRRRDLRRLDRATRSASSPGTGCRRCRSPTRAARAARRLPGGARK